MRSRTEIQEVLEGGATILLVAVVDDVDLDDRLREAGRIIADCRGRATKLTLPSAPRVRMCTIPSFSSDTASHHCDVSFMTSSSVDWGKTSGPA